MRKKIAYTVGNHQSYDVVKLRVDSCQEHHNFDFAKISICMILIAKLLIMIANFYVLKSCK